MTISANRFLSLEEMTINAQYLMDAFLNRGWTKNAICGMLGNMQTESTINPGIWQGLHEGNLEGGYGLVQWTPATKYINWAELSGYQKDDINAQIERIQYEVDAKIQWYSTSDYPLTFQEFTQSTQTPYYLGMAFLRNYERPANPDQPKRGQQAEYWFNNLEGGGGVITEKKRSMPIWYYGRLFKRRL